MTKVIAIDGPAGAGKSTLARLLAYKLGYRYLDTGAMYRALTWLALEKGLDLNDEEALTELAREIDIKISFPKDNGDSSLIVNGLDLTEKIRKPIVSQNVSQLAKVKGVREAMIYLQREIAKEGKIILDGRDIGSRVIPDAEIKFFVTASLEERAQRRFNELKDKHPNLSFSELEKSIAKRDKIDSERKISPLIKTEDAILIDTTNLSIEEVLEKVLNIFKKR